MAEFNKLTITNKGQALMSKIIAGSGNIEFTKVSASSNIYTESQILALTSLANVKQTVAISKITRINNVSVQIEAAMENSKLTSGYNMNSIGLYAKDPDDGEILYAVASVLTSDKGAYMPPFNGLTASGAYFKLTTTVSNSDNVSLEVDQAAVATIGDVTDLQNQISDLQAFIGYTDNDIYGVEVDFVNKKFTRLANAVGKIAGENFDAVNAFGGRKRCIMTDAGIVLAYHGDVGYTETGALTQAITLGEGDAAVTYPVGTKVQVMVEQPKFYYKVVPIELEKITHGEGKGHHTKKIRYYISDVPKTGFKLHPQFISNGVERNVIYKSAFEGSLYDASASAYILDDAQVADFASDMLSSIANAKPMSGLTQNLTRANVRKLAQKRGTGWQQSTIQSHYGSMLLFLIEYASFNTQKSIGMGNVSKTDDGTTNMSEVTGATTNLGNTSGSVANTNGINMVSYRGEENLWGNIWIFLDGINIVNGGVGEVYIADNNFADDSVASPYKNAGISIAQTSGYVSAFAYNEEFDWLFIPSKTAGNDSLPVGDNYYQNVNGTTAKTIACVGGKWDSGSHAGGFYVDVDSASSHRYRNIGGRLVYVPDAA